MKIGVVMGSIWCTRKDEALHGLKLMQVRVLEAHGSEEDGDTVVAADMIGAGTGEKVLLVSGSSARKHACLQNAPVDLLIVGIIDPDNDIHA